MAASAQSVFTVESNGQKYSFPLESTTITVTDDEPTQPAQAPVYKSNLKGVSLFGKATTFQFKGMSLIADYMWAGKLMPRLMILSSSRQPPIQVPTSISVLRGMLMLLSQCLVLQPKEALSSIPSRVVISRIPCLLSLMSALHNIV